jgi:hypothetical protein
MAMINNHSRIISEHARVSALHNNFHTLCLLRHFRIARLNCANGNDRMLIWCQESVCGTRGPCGQNGALACWRSRIETQQWQQRYFYRNLSNNRSFMAVSRLFDMACFLMSFPRWEVAVRERPFPRRHYKNRTFYFSAWWLYDLCS